MAQLSIAYCRQLAQARRAKSLTQSALAEAVGCKQSAISMLESGQAEKIAQETVGKIAALLGVKPEGAGAEPADAGGAPAVGRGYCPSAACASNVPYVTAGELLFWPRPQPAAASHRHCAYCGELLEHRCPNCGAPVTEGACCRACGAARVANTLPPGTDPAAWAAQRCRELAEWRSLVS